MNWADVISVGFEHGSLTVKIGPVVWVIVLILVGIAVVAWFKKGARWPWGYEIVEAELKIANIDKV